MRSTLTALILVLLGAGAYVLLDPLDRVPDNLPGVNDLPGVGALTGSSPEAMKAEIAAAMNNSDSYPFDFSLQSTEGQTISKADFAGRVLIVDVWATWCPPCREEVPHFVELQDEYREKGLSIVGLNYEKAPSREEAIAAIADFTAEIPVNYPLLIGDRATQQQIPGFQGYPTTLFIDRQGRVRLTLVGMRSKAELEAVVQVLLDEAT